MDKDIILEYIQETKKIIEHNKRMSKNYLAGGYPEELLRNDIEFINDKVTSLSNLISNIENIMN